MERLSALAHSLQASVTTAPGQVIDKAPHGMRKTKLDFFKASGWGFHDTQFILDRATKKISLSGTHYVYSGKAFPKLHDFIIEETGMNFTDTISPKKDLPVDEPRVNEGFMSAVKTVDCFSRLSFQKMERIQHSHAHSLQEVYALRMDRLPRYADCVIYPESHKQCEALVKLANEHNAVLIPYGGGTNVSQALMLSETEERMIVSVDMSRMNRVIWVDRTNNTACVECGILGRDLERELGKYGMICGHEPDSVEFSSLGGWISTRASGMKKNVYGNIEDVVESVKLVTPTGTFTKMCEAPRVSTGPDLTNFLLGSEGNFGLLTEATIKIRQIPESKEYGSVVFPDFETGIKFMRELARTRDWPASARLVDNMQFRFGVALKPEEHSKFKEFMDKVKKYYVTKLKHFDVDKMVALTLVFEGTKARTASQQKMVYSLAKKFNGLKGGAENGIRGYFLTFMIAYIRDFVLDHYYMGESFETAVPWDKLQDLCSNVHSKILTTCKEKGVIGKAFASFRVTQVYETGATVYIYFGFSYKGLKDAVKVYTEIEHEARQEIIKNGGSLSHHHGIGKLRKPFFKGITGEVGVEMLRAIKNKLDPKNIFATGNLIDP